MQLPGLDDLLKRPFLTAIVTIFSVWLLSFVVRTIAWRLHIRKLGARGLPMPPHSLLFGHALVIAKLLGQLPSDAHPFYMPDQVRRSYPDLGPNFYMDLWPFAPPILVLGSPDTLYQIAQEHVLQKYPLLKKFLRPLTDALDIVTMEGATWKKWRGIFNPGFGSAHLMTLVPLIVTETETYCQLLDKHAEAKDVFTMKQLTDNLTLDIIGRLALDTHFDCQKTSNQMIKSLRTQMRWMTTGIEPNFFDRHNPLRPFVQWYHARIVNEYVSKELDQRFAMRQNTSTEKQSGSKRNRTIIDLALDAYNAQQPKGALGPNLTAMDPFVKRICMSQIKVFLFSGHDTTSSSICFHLYCLSQNPSTLTKIREEHDSVFGTDPSTAASQISSSPYLLNQLPYTTAIIKESLRLFPTVTNSRLGEANFSVKDSLGRSFPTESFLVFPNIHTPHHNPAYWPDVDMFKPERWLVGPEDPLYPPKGVWRAFEQGPRNCIGQELAMLEMKTVLVLTARTYLFKPAYEFLDAKAGKRTPDVHGVKAYQVNFMQPRGDLPVWVERKDKA